MVQKCAVFPVFTIIKVPPDLPHRGTGRHDPELDGLHIMGLRILVPRFDLIGQKPDVLRGVSAGLALLLRNAQVPEGHRLILIEQGIVRLRGLRFRCCQYGVVG